MKTYSVMPCLPEIDMLWKVQVVAYFRRYVGPKGTASPLHCAGLQ